MGNYRDLCYGVLMFKVVQLTNIKLIKCSLLLVLVFISVLAYYRFFFFRFQSFSELILWVFSVFLFPIVFSSKSGGNSSSSVEDEVSASIRPLISSAGENIGQGERAFNSQLPAQSQASRPQQHRENKTLKPSHVSAQSISSELLVHFPMILLFLQLRTAGALRLGLTTV